LITTRSNAPALECKSYRAAVTGRSASMQAPHRSAVGRDEKNRMCRGTKRIIKKRCTKNMTPIIDNKMNLISSIISSIQFYISENKLRNFSYYISPPPQPSPAKEGLKAGIICK